jgi:FAD/FMN-containing dehydrogenase
MRPASIDELKALLERVHADGGTLRVPGSLHSCSEIVVSDAILDTAALPKSIDFDAGDAAVEATANVTLHEFLAELGSHGKSVTATGGTDHQTLAGLISTGTAPASSRHALYEKLDWVELVFVDDSGTAQERRIARGDPDFPAVICSLGLLGVLTRVRFSLVDELYFDVVMKIVELEDVLADLEATSAKYDFWRVNWAPKSDKALLWAATAVPKDKSKPGGDYSSDSSEHILDVVFKVLDKIADTGPLLNFVLEAVYDVMALTYGTKRATGPLRNMLPVDRRSPLHVAMAEWSFRPDDLDEVLAECRKYFGEHGWPNIPTEIEPTRVDGSFMSAWNWPGLSYIVKLNFMYLTEVCTKPGEKDQIYAHLRGLWDHLKAAGIPFKAHWGKVNFIDPAFAAHRHDVDAFKPLAQPMLANEYLVQRLGPL